MELKEFCNKLSKPVQWYEGALLAPHHFQQSDLYYHQYINCLIRSGNYYGYGVVNFVFDSALMISGVIKILVLEAIMPDGSLIQYNAEDSGIMYQRDLKNEIKNHRSVKIYVSVPIHKNGQSNFSGEIPRYVSLKENVTDENTGENDVDVVKKSIAFYIHTQDDLSTKFASIPIAEIKYTNTGIQKTDYLPPMLFVAQDGELHRLCKNIVLIIKQKIGYIISKKTFLSTTEGLDEKLHLLITGVLPVEALINTKGISPFDLYSKLADLAAILIAFTHGDIIPDLPSYVHEDVYTTFYSLQLLIIQGIDKLIDTSANVPFMLEDDIFFLKIEPSWIPAHSNRIVVGIRKSTGITYDEFVHWVNGLQITSREFIDDVIQRRVLGANRRIETDMEVMTSISDNIINLSIDVHSNHVKAGEELCIFNKSNKRASDEIILFLKEDNN